MRTFHFVKHLNLTCFLFRLKNLKTMKKNWRRTLRLVKLLKHETKAVVLESVVHHSEHDEMLTSKRRFCVSPPEVLERQEPKEFISNEK